jgi:hypothetical protein
VVEPSPVICAPNNGKRKAFSFGFFAFGFSQFCFISQAVGWYSGGIVQYVGGKSSKSSNQVTVLPLCVLLLSITVVGKREKEDAALPTATLSLPLCHPLSGLPSARKPFMPSPCPLALLALRYHYSLQTAIKTLSTLPHTLQTN